MWLLMFIGGFTTCYLLIVLGTKRKVVGSLRIDRSDPEDGPYLFLTLSKEISELARKPFVILRVELKERHPHK